MSTSFFLPTRKGSQRINDKNTRSFAEYPGGIFELKLRQLIDSTQFDEIIVSTNDENCLRIAADLVGSNPLFRIIRRPDQLCLDTTPLKDLIYYAGEICTAEDILWGHVTTPMAIAKDYDLIVQTFSNQKLEGYDSLVTVLPVKNFFIQPFTGHFINSVDKSMQWPRTQDLQEIYEINHVAFLAPREIYLQHGNRIGKRPWYYPMSKLRSIDIDWEEDFLIAEALYEKFYGAKGDSLGF